MAGSLLLVDNVPLQNRLPSNGCSSDSYPRSLNSISCPRPLYRRGINDKLHLKKIIFIGQYINCYRLKHVSAFSSEDAYPVNQVRIQLRAKSLEQWDSLTSKFAGAANLPFLLLQLPQIILNTRNLLEGNNSALLAVPWLGMFTGLLGNLSLLSYFIKKREKEAIVVQTLGVISTYIVIMQLAMAEAMPLPHFIATSIVIASGLILNLLKYFHLLNAKIWHFWEEFITIAGLSALPQVMWSTFVPYIPNTILPGMIAFFTSVLIVRMARLGKLSYEGNKVLGLIHIYVSFLVIAIELLLMKINSFSVDKSFESRQHKRFTGSGWACVFYGWGNLICLYCFNSINRDYFLASTFGFLAWIGTSRS
ncbi:hypothetical protein BUALT_Bualt08G0107500 [Buddleja alternifolia]|uniref:Uncharacterized protein n=1 Tax=Buddleja alternifolia TaxID=168488 RepID=A0AAV6X6X4_9LAMI|nr:hypothetical protein BUALT_Bualt08G0107500 [Buddleja alternifolia]